MKIDGYDFADCCLFKFLNCDHSSDFDETLWAGQGTIANFVDEFLGSLTCVRKKKKIIFYFFPFFLLGVFKCENLHGRKVNAHVLYYGYLVIGIVILPILVKFFFEMLALKWINGPSFSLSLMKKRERNSRFSEIWRTFPTL